jgi:hypothetical protein
VKFCTSLALGQGNVDAEALLLASRTSRCQREDVFAAGAELLRAAPRLARDNTPAVTFPGVLDS